MSEFKKGDRVDVWDRVYCCDCRHFASLDTARYMADVCSHPNNVSATFKSPSGRILREAADINANNDCRWFDPKGGARA